MTELEKTDEGSHLDFGKSNIFWGTFGDVAGGDIQKSISIQHHYHSPLVPETRRQLEQEYLQFIFNKLESWRLRFLDLNLRLDLTTVKSPSSSQLASYMQGEFEHFIYKESVQDEASVVAKNTFELFSYNNVWVLCGEPGSGKTTLLRKLEYEQAQLSLHTILPSYVLTTSSIAINTGLLPVYIDLALFEYKGVGSLIELIDNAWKGSGLGLDIRYYLKMEKLLLLIDNIDAVSASMQVEFIYELRKLLVQNLGNQCVVAARTGSLRNELGFSKCTVEPLTDTQVHQLLINYAGNQGSALYRHIVEHFEELRWIIRNPYNLMMILQAYRSPEGIPDNQAALYRRFTHRLLARELERSSIPNNYVQIFEETLAKLAYRLIANDERFIPLLSVSDISTDNIDVSTLSQVIETGRNMGILVISPDSQLAAFIHDMLLAYFGGLKLRDLVNSNVTYLEDLVQLDIVESNVAYPRAPLFTSPEVGQSPWDSPTPLLSRNRWYYALRNLMDFENNSGYLFEKLLSYNSILVSDLIVSENLKVTENIIKQVKLSLVSLMTEYMIPKRVRFTAGYWLGKIGDHRLEIENMVFIDGREIFLMGDSRANCIVTIHDFFVDKYLVTNAQYQLFINDNAYNRQELWCKAGWVWLNSTNRKQPTYSGIERFNLPNAPVVGISWYEADAYARWRGTRLLTEAEWEYLATYDPRTEIKRIYPWGNEFAEHRANLKEGDYLFQPSPVGMYPAGVNPWNIHDLAGNVWEWLSSLYLPYPFDITLTEKIEHPGLRCLRGGSWGFDSKPGAQGTERHMGDPKSVEHPNKGFRCSRSIVMT